MCNIIKLQQADGLINDRCRFLQKEPAVIEWLIALPPCSVIARVYKWHRFSLVPDKTLPFLFDVSESREQASGQICSKLFVNIREEIIGSQENTFRQNAVSSSIIVASHGIKFSIIVQMLLV